MLVVSYWYYYWYQYILLCKQKQASRTKDLSLGQKSARRPVKLPKPNISKPIQFQRRRHPNIK